MIYLLGTAGYETGKTSISFSQNALDISITSCTSPITGYTRILGTVYESPSSFICCPQNPARERLSDREQEVFRKMGDGYSTADLAARFEISPNTVETYYARIREKLDLNGTKAIRLLAIRFMKAR